MGRGPLLLWVREGERDIYPNPNTRAIDLLARRLRAAGSRFIVIEGPIPPGHGALPAPERTRAFREALRARAKAEGFTFVSAADMADFALEDFRDQTHLNARGRRTFTDALEKILRSRPGAG